MWSKEQQPVLVAELKWMQRENGKEEERERKEKERKRERETK